MGQKELEILLNEYSKCDLCPLHETRKNVVFGVGALRKLLIVGEAPGKNENKQGLPFIGRAGECLQFMLSSAGIRPVYKNTFINEDTEVYYTNTVLCRPIIWKGDMDYDREPTQEEIRACNGRLHKEITAVDPSVIILAGKVARMALARNAKVYDYTQVKIVGESNKIVFPAYIVDHPAFVVRKGCVSGNTVFEKNVEVYRRAAEHMRLIYALREGKNPIEYGEYKFRNPKIKDYF